MNENQQKRRQKNGAHARMAFYMALASMFGNAVANSAYTRKRAGRHMNRVTKGAFGSKRAGFKLVKKMARRQASPKLKGVNA